MNLYIRYFDNEAIAHNVQEAVDFLSGLDIQNFDLGQEFVQSLESYIASNVSYPKRYKVRAHIYFIVIKTDAETMEAFKEYVAKMHPEEGQVEEKTMDKKKLRQNLLEQKVQGWYDAVLNFKRVIAIAGTNKFQYKDTRFRVLCYAESPQECYTRIVNHLKGRYDVDERSQFPSIKGRNFEYTYLGKELPKEYYQNQ